MSAEEMKNSLDNFDTNQNQDETIKNLHESLKDSGVRKELMTITKDGLKFLEESEKDSLISSCKDLISQLLPDIKKNKKGEISYENLTQEDRANIGLLYLYTALTTGKSNPFPGEVNTAYKSIVAEKTKNEKLVNNPKTLETIKVDKIDIPEKAPITLETNKINEKVQKKQEKMTRIIEEQETNKTYNSFKEAGFISEDKINFKKDKKFNAKKIENIIERNLDAHNLTSDSGKNLQDLISNSIKDLSLENNKKYIFIKGAPSENLETAKSTASTNSKTMEYLGYIKSNPIFVETIKIDNGDGTFTYAQMFESSDNEEKKEKGDDKEKKTIKTEKIKVNFDNALSKDGNKLNEDNKDNSESSSENLNSIEKNKIENIDKNFVYTKGEEISGDIIIAEEGIKGNSPIYRYNEKTKSYNCINYTAYKNIPESIIKEKQEKYKRHEFTEQQTTEQQTTEQQTTEQQTTDEKPTFEQVNYDILKKNGNIIESGIEGKLKPKKTEKELKNILNTDNLGIVGSLTLEADIMKAIRDGKLDNKKEYIFVKGMPARSSSNAKFTLKTNIDKIKNTLGEETLSSILQIKNKDGTTTYVRMFEKKKEQ